MIATARVSTGVTVRRERRWTSAGAQLVDVLYCVQCAAVSPIGVLFRLQIGLENGFENQNCRHFRRPIPDGGYPNGRCFPSGLGMYTRRTGSG